MTDDVDLAADGDDLIDEDQEDDEASGDGEKEGGALPVLSRDEPIELTVEARAHGWRLDHYLSRLFPNYSRVLFQKAISGGGVTVNGLGAKASRRVRVNDRIDVVLPEEPDDRLVAEDIPIEIIYEDESLAVINKAADMVTHPGKGNFFGTLAAAVQFHFNQLSDVAGLMRPGIVHRLDRDTTGVIVIAKSNQTHGRISKQFEQREVTKEYRAIVRGEIELQSDIIETFVRVHPKAREKMIVCPESDGARHAVTQYEVLERFEGFTYVRLLPKTGRTHQLRVHMQHLGYPIVADRLYAGHGELRLRQILSPKSLASAGEDVEDTLISRQALHAYRLELRHPETDRPMVFQADLPADMQRTLDALREHRGVRRTRG